MVPVSMYRAVFEIKKNVGLDLIKYNKGTWIPPLGGGFKSLRSPVYLDPQDYNADLRDEQVNLYHRTYAICYFGNRQNSRVPKCFFAFRRIEVYLQINPSGYQESVSYHQGRKKKKAPDNVIKGRTHCATKGESKLGRV